MPFQRQRASLTLTEDEKKMLTAISRSRTESLVRVQRAQILLLYATGESISSIARQIDTNRPRIERCVDKALQLGVITSLEDLPRSGRNPSITSEAKKWILNLACLNPKDLGYSHKVWTMPLLAKHIRQHAPKAGHSCLENITKSTVSKILKTAKIRPHKISSYLDGSNLDFETKMVQVLYIYKDLEILRQINHGVSCFAAILPYDEEPGIQVIEGKTDGFPQLTGKHYERFFEYEYIRQGTLGLLAGIDLLNGHVHGMVVNRNRSRDFISFLKVVDQAYPPQAKIQIVLDNHSAPLSKETRKHLSSRPGRFEFIFTPANGSWLNLIESFYCKMVHTMLRQIRVSSKDEFKKKIEQYLDEINKTPIVFRWEYGLDAISIT